MAEKKNDPPEIDLATEFFGIPLSVWITIICTVVSTIVMILIWRKMK